MLKEKCVLIVDDEPDAVDIVEIMQVASRWNCKDLDACFSVQYDFDNDGDIDIVDIMQVAAQWGWSK